MDIGEYCDELHKDPKNLARMMRDIDENRDITRMMSEINDKKRDEKSN
jgi:hypothetical protein